MLTNTHRHAWPVFASLVAVAGVYTPGRPVATVGSAVSVASASPASAPVDTSTFAYISGGVHVIQRVTPGNDVVAVKLYFLGGVMQLTPATAGVEDLALRTLPYGSARYPGAASRRSFSRTGSEWLETSGSDWSMVGFVGITDRFDSTWTVFADRVAHPTLDSSAISLVRSRMIRELRLIDLSPERLAALVADSLGVDGHPYAIHPYGSLASLASLNPEVVRQYVASQFVTSRMLLVVVGNVSRAHLDSLVSSTIGTLPPGRYVKAVLPSFAEHRTAVVSLSRPTATSYLVGWYAGPPITDKDYPSFEVATSWLSSRLNRAIREKNNLSYAAYATTDDRALASGGLYVSTGDPKTVVPMMQRIVDSLKMSPDEDASWYLGDFAKELRGGYLMEHESNEGQATALAEAQILFGDYRETANELQRYRGVNLGSVIHAVRRYMHDMQFAYVGDTSHFRADWIRR